MTLRDFCSTPACYARSHGRVRPTSEKNTLNEGLMKKQWIAVPCLMMALCGLSAAQDSPKALFATEKTCVETPAAELEKQSRAGDIAAAHVLGLMHFGDRYDAHFNKSAEPYFRKGADQLYPPSLYWYWTALTVEGKDNERHFPLLLEAAQRGYVRAQLDLVFAYANPTSRHHDRVAAYAWLTLCKQLDASCRDYTDEQLIPELTDHEKDAGNLLNRDIIEKRKSYPTFVEYSNCGRESWFEKE